MHPITSYGRCSIVAVVSVAATVAWAVPSASSGNAKELKSQRRIIVSRDDLVRVDSTFLTGTLKTNNVVVREYKTPTNKVAPNEMESGSTSVSLESLLDDADEAFLELVSESRKEMAGHLKSESAKPSLKLLRLQAGLSQKELGDLVGIRQPHVSRLEKRGGDVKSSRLTALASALKVSEKEVFEALNG